MENVFKTSVTRKLSILVYKVNALLALSISTLRVNCVSKRYVTRKLKYMICSENAKIVTTTSTQKVTSVSKIHVHPINKSSPSKAFVKTAPSTSMPI